MKNIFFAFALASFLLAAIFPAFSQAIAACRDDCHSKCCTDSLCRGKDDAKCLSDCLKGCGGQDVPPVPPPKPAANTK